MLTFNIRLTPESHFHDVKMDETSYNQFVSVYSSTSDPYKSHVFNIVHNDNGKLMSYMYSWSRYSYWYITDLPTAERVTELELLVKQVEPRMFNLTAPEMFNFESSRGETVYGCIFKPHDFDPSQRYPCVVKVYGGPHVQVRSGSESILWWNSRVPAASYKWL